MEKSIQELLYMTNSQSEFDRDAYVKEQDEMTNKIFEEFKRQQEHTRKINLLNALRKNSLLGEKYKDCSFESTEIVSDNFENVFNRCEMYCRVADEVLARGLGIYIYGKSCGSGKTHLTACICNELLNQYHECMFTSITDMSKKIMATFSGKGDTEAVIKLYADVDFLFLDDVGVEAVKKNDGDNWLQQQIYEIINLRYSNLKPTIFTSNYSIAELIEKRGMWERTVDRITEMSSVIMNLEGESYRLRKRRNNSVPF